jgi:tripartite-type tricarboxylate transporter receptor subunit TctC
MRALLIGFGLVMSVLTGTTTVHSQGFPNKLIRIIVPFTPGGSNDVVGREIASGLQERFNQTAVVENKPGGGGTIAYQYVAKSAPDGYTLMIAPASFTMGPHLSRNPVYNPIKEFAPVILVADVPFVLVVPSSLPVRSLKELIDLAKTSQNKLSFGSVGVGTPQHLGGELFKISAGVDMVHVPFRGATAAIPDLLAGRIDVFIGAINSLLPLIKEGKLRAIAMAGKTRVPSLPDVPTIAELAFPDYELGSAVGLVAPAGTPPDVVETLNREIGKIIATPGFRERMQKIGLDVVGSTPAAYAKFLSDDYNKWAKVVAAAGLKPQ